MTTAPTPLSFTRLPRYRVGLLALLGWLLAATALAGPEARRWSELADISFQRLTQDQGLPNAIATTSVQDAQGFLWVGSLGGLARWDGYRFKVYKSDAGDPGALPDNYIQALHVDPQGRLWVGTSTGGLVRYDALADRFERVPVGGAQGLAHVSVRQILDDGEGGLWVLTEGGLDRLDPASGRIEHASQAGGWAAAAGLQTRVIYRDRAGVLWLGSAAGLFRRAPDAAGLEPVRLRAGEAVQPEAITLDAAGRLWVGSFHHGVFVIPDQGRGQARAVGEFDARVDTDALRGPQITDLLEVQPGEMWVAMLGFGIVAVDLEHARSRRIRHVPAWPMSLADNALRSLYRDRAGQVWVATNRGLSRYDPHQAAVLTRFGSGEELERPGATPVSAEISWVQPLPNGQLWLGTHGSGIDILDDSGARRAALRPDPGRPEQALPLDIIVAMAPAPDGWVYVATKRGLYRVEPERLRVERVHLAGRDPAAPTWALRVLGDTLWIGGQFDGLWTLSVRSGQSKAVKPAAPGLSDQRITVLAPASDPRKLWVGTRNGLNLLDLDSLVPQCFLPGPTAHGLSGGFVTAVMSDAQNRVWVGSYGGGIDVLAPDAAAVQTRIGLGQGLPDGTVNALLQDLQGKVWASTDNGLARIDPQDGAVRALRRAEGVLLPTYWTGSAARTDRGELLFGGAGGLTVVRPELLRDYAYRPRVLVSQLRVGGQARPLPAPGELLRIEPARNSLAVEFSSSDYTAPERNQFAYRLEGFDADWQPSDPTRRTAAYTNLPPGDYLLQLRASNRDGRWVETPLALPLRVEAAWYQTWWWRGSVAMAGLVLFFGAVALRTRWQHRRQAQLERRVRERTAELERLHQVLEQKSAQLELSSVTDPLTGVHNRRFLSGHIEQDLLARLRRAQEPRPGAPADTDTLFLLLDIDGFKGVNDAYGHAAGDVVLVQFAARLRAEMRESDYVVRWGGEEFLAVARDTDRRRAEELAERLRACIADRPFLLPDGEALRVSCSLGFACLPFEAGKPLGLTWQEVVRLADEALYIAKRTGRDAWVGAAPEAGVSLMPWDGHWVGSSASAEKLEQALAQRPAQA